MTTKDTTTEESPYATDTDEDQTGKPVGPEHDASFSAPDFYDPQTGKRIETDWDTEAQKNDPGYDPAVMAGATEKRASGGEGGEKAAPKVTKS